MGSSKTKSRDHKKEKKTSSKSSSKAQSAIKSPQTFKSTEFVAESDNENDEAVRSEPDSESDSDNDSLPSNPADAKPTSNNKIAESSSSESQSDSESESGSGSEDEDEEEEDNESNTNGKGETVPPPSKSTVNGSSKPVSAQKPAPFKAPSGFTAVPLKGSSQASKLFDKSKLAGKQIWYITAPASVPIDSIQNMTLRGAKLGETAVSQNGNDYGFVQDVIEDKTYTKIMLPNNSKDGYCTEKKAIDQVFHLQQIVKLADGGVSSNEIPSRATVPAKRPVRQQPKGLRMRYQPIGFAMNGPSSDDEQTDKDEAAPAEFQRPEGLDSDVEMEDVQPTKKAKSKKSSKDSAATEDRSSKRKHKDSGDKKKKHKHKA